jgi:hypothetical protein
MEDNEVKIPTISKKLEEVNQVDDVSIQDLLNVYMELIESKKVRERPEDSLNIERIKKYISLKPVMKV